MTLIAHRSNPVAIPLPLKSVLTAILCVLRKVRAVGCRPRMALLFRTRSDRWHTSAMFADIDAIDL